MVIDAERADEIKKVYTQYFDYKEEAKTLSGSANDLMKGLAQRMAGDDDYKPILKGLKKAYVEWKAENEGEEDSLEPAIQILEAIK